MNGTKCLQLLICYHEKARFSSLILIRREFTVERVEITVGNCSRSLMFRINLWKGVIVRPRKMETTFWKPQADSFFENGTLIQEISHPDVRKISY